MNCSLQGSSVHGILQARILEWIARPSSRGSSQRIRPIWEPVVETLEKALGLHFISKMGLTCLWQLESHVEFTASNFGDAWQLFNIVRNPNITVSNRERDLNSHLTSRSVCIFLPCRVYIPELSLIPNAEQLRFPNQTHKEPQFASLNSRKSPTTLSQDEKNTDVTSGTQNWLVYPKSTQDGAHFPFIESIAVSHSTSWIYSSPPLYNHKGFDLGCTFMTSCFSLLSSI